MLLDVFAWLGEVVGHGHGEAAAAAAPVGAGEKGIWGEGEWRTEWGARGQVGEGTEAPQGGGILIASAVTPTSWSGRDCSVAGARSREQWRRKATEGVRGRSGLAGPRLSWAGGWSRPRGSGPFHTFFLFLAFF